MPTPSPLLLACLCAGWCNTCEAYRPTLQALAAAHPALRTAWVDIEDHADALEGEHGEAPDIENFPTLLLVQDGQPRFFGTVLPHAAVAERLLAQAWAGALPPLREPGAVHLAQAVERLLASGALD